MACEEGRCASLGVQDDGKDRARVLSSYVVRESRRPKPICGRLDKMTGKFRAEGRLGETITSSQYKPIKIT